MNWLQFPFFALPALVLWLAAATAAVRGARRTSVWCAAAGLAVYAVFLAGLWSSMQHPPMRTMGETRLWYTFFLALAGLVVYVRQHYRLMPVFSFFMCLVFTCTNLFKPELHHAALMPVLQSPWFVPHVTVYMVSYALLGFSAVMALHLLCVKPHAHADDTLLLCDRLVRTGLGFMTAGMLMGALWAEAAWGRCWSWDPKETWAAAAWLLYLGYLHLRRMPSQGPRTVRMALILLLAACCCLQMCWYGMALLPSAGASLHAYP